MGACYEALEVGVLVAPLNSRYTQVGFNFISVQVCLTSPISDSVGTIHCISIAEKLSLKIYDEILLHKQQ